MSTLVLDKKKYVVIPQDEYNRLLKASITKKQKSKILTLEEGKKLAYSLIDKWHSEK